MEEIITVVLGVFNKPNRNNQVYHITEKELKVIMDKKINNCFGEMQYPILSKEPSEYLERVQQIDPLNNSGILKAYNIVKDKQVIKDAGSVLTLYGEVIPSDKLKDYISSGATPYFGIRSLGIQRGNRGDDNRYQHYDCKFLSFDLIPEDPRTNTNNATIAAIC